MEIRSTNWWWISLPRATAAIHTTDGVVDITAPYMRFTLGWPMEKVIDELHRAKGVKIIEMRDDNDEEDSIRYS
jgi:hypothetical protein